MKHLNLILGFGLTISSFCIGIEIGKKSKPFRVVQIDLLEKYVYRGIRNPISIQIPNAKYVDVSANGLVKDDDFGHYSFTPGPGNRAMLHIKAVMIDGSEFKDSVKLKIGNIPNSIRYFAGVTPNYEQIPKLSIKTLDAGKLTMERAFRYDESITVQSFLVKIPGMDFKEMKSDSLSQEMISILRKQKKGTQIIMSNVKAKSSFTGFLGITDDKVQPIVIEIL